MPAERYFVDSSLLSNTLIDIEGAEFHHLAHVMRTRKGDPVELINGQGTLAQGSVEQLFKDRAKIHLHEIHQEPLPPSRLILAQAFAKQHRMDLLLEKGTELGVDAFWIFPGDHSAKKELYPNQLERCHTVLIAAMKQCGRLYLPSLILTPPLKNWKKNESTLFFGDLNPGVPLFKASWEKIYPPSYPIVFITGPEGGFSSEEINKLYELEGHGVRLHDNILRAETASLMALSLLSHWILN